MKLEYFNIHIENSRKAVRCIQRNEKPVVGRTTVLLCLFCQDAIRIREVGPRKCQTSDSISEILETGKLDSRGVSSGDSYIGSVAPW